MTKIEIFKKIKERFTSVDLDDHVHELKSAEAAAINNSGIDFQLKYLYEAAGSDWLIDIFIKH